MLEKSDKMNDEKFLENHRHKLSMIKSRDKKHDYNLDNGVCPNCDGHKYITDIDSNEYLLKCDICMGTGFYNT